MALTAAGLNAPIHFRQFGRTCQLRLENVDDLRQVLALDDSHWMATSAPSQAFRCDPVFISRLDTNGTGRITSDEVRGAVRWLLEQFRDSAAVNTGADAIDLNAIRAEEGDVGQKLVKSAAYVLKVLRADESRRISLDQVRDFLSQIQQRPLNGDGVIVPEAARDDDLATYLRDAVSCTGGHPDASGRRGVTRDDIEAFSRAIDDYLTWKQTGDDALDTSPSELAPFGANTAHMSALMLRHADRVDAFFALGRALRYEPRAASRAAGETESELADLDTRQAGSVNEFLGRLPVARISADAALPLEGDAVNPAYRAWLSELRSQVLTPVLGGERVTLTEDEWRAVRIRLAPFERYMSEKKGIIVENLPVASLHAYSQSDFLDRAVKLCEQDANVATVLAGVHEVEKLLLFQKHMLRFVNNYVSFSELYTPDCRAMFEMGSAVIDGRWFNLALQVEDMAAHAAVAKSSGIFTIYLEVTLSAGNRKSVVALPATSGSKGNLTVGKRGIFFDIHNIEHDARVVQIIDNPISLREALVSPFVRLWQFILGKLEAISSASEKELQKQADTLLASPATQPAARVPGGPAGLLMGLSVSAAAVGSALAFITRTFAELTLREALGGLMAVILVVVIPAALVAVLKLRRQDLSSLLEGCGWAINARMRLSREQRRQFTRRPPYPPGAIGVPRHRTLLFILVLILCHTIGFLLFSRGWW